MEEFFCKTKIVSGPGAVRALDRFQARRLFLVTSPRLMTDGTARRIAGITGAQQVEYFDKADASPTVELAAEGTARLRAFGPDLLVALGSGGTLDCAKVMGYLGRGSWKVAAIPTTSGPGAEVTDFALLTHNRGRVSLTDRRLRPDMAILDSDLLAQLPQRQIAQGGFVVLAHALEAYVAKGAGAVTDLYAREAFSIAYGGLPASYAGNQQVRLRIHLAATMAGMAVSQAGAGLCQALANSLGGLFSLPQGQLDAILLPSVVACNAHVAGKRYGELARAAGIPGSTDSAAVEHLRNSLLRLRRELNLPGTLAQAGISPRSLWQNLETIVSRTLQDPCRAGNPMACEGFVVRRILEEVTGRM